MLRRAFVVLLFCLFIASSLWADKPGLVVFISVDQCRWDLPLKYKDRFGPDGFLYISDALCLDRFFLLVHSMGAGIASLVAAACPQRVERLVAIEALGALAEVPERTVARMRDPWGTEVELTEGLRALYR